MKQTKYIYRVFSSKGKPLYQVATLSKVCRLLKLKEDTVRRHFNRHPDENSYGVFDGNISLGKLKYIIIREDVNENK